MILATQFHALSHPTRTAIVKLFKEHGELNVTQIADALSEQGPTLSQSRVSFHLKALKEASLLTVRKEWHFTYYSLNPAALVLMAERLMVLAGEMKFKSIEESVLRECANWLSAEAGIFLADAERAVCGCNEPGITADELWRRVRLEGICDAK